MIHFPNITLERYRLTESSNKGVYGETLTDYSYTCDIPVDFQNENNQETRREYGVDKQNLYKIYVDENISLEDTDIFRDNTTGAIYEIIGEIQTYNHFHHYKKAHLIHSNTRITPSLPVQVRIGPENVLSYYALDVVEWMYSVQFKVGDSTEYIDGVEYDFLIDGILSGHGVSKKKRSDSVLVVTIPDLPPGVYPITIQASTNEYRVTSYNIDAFVEILEVD